MKTINEIEPLELISYYNEATKLPGLESSVNLTEIQRDTLIRNFKSKLHEQEIKILNKHVTIKVYVEDVNATAIKVFLPNSYGDVYYYGSYDLGEYASPYFTIQSTHINLECQYHIKSLKEKALALSKGDYIEIKGKIIEISGAGLTYNSVWDFEGYWVTLDLISVDIIEQPTNVKEGCFIATAAFGNEDHTVVVKLRIFRDQQLMPFYFGRLFVRLYYLVSPPIACYVQRSPILRKTIRAILKRSLLLLPRGSKC